MPGRPTRAVAEQRWVDVWRLHDAGHGQRQIARELAIGLASAQHYLGKGRPPDQLVDQLAAARRPTTSRRRSGSRSGGAEVISIVEAFRRVGER